MSEIDDEVQWHTWSGRRHKFGPLIESVGRWAKPTRVARCNTSISTDEATQGLIDQTSVCKRCFPDAPA